MDDFANILLYLGLAGVFIAIIAKALFKKKPPLKDD